ncbi:MAG: hypothetical protein P0Y60_14625 [Candidatus Microbacterium colombiense]|nr:MAG: hypothetical protein P0Y60_14625 [Microbacterium sp.]
MSGVQAYRRRAAETERTVDAAVAAVKAERAAEFEQSKREHAEREAARRVYTREDIVGAGFVHDGHWWRKVVRVNKTSVSVETGHSWVDRIPFSKVHGIQQPLKGAAEEQKK